MTFLQLLQIVILVILGVTLFGSFDSSNGQKFKLVKHQSFTKIIDQRHTALHCTALRFTDKGLTCLLRRP
jgi:hypothetical protein